MIKDLIRLNLTELQTNTFSTILSVSLGSYEILELDETRSIREKPSTTNTWRDTGYLPTWTAVIVVSICLPEAGSKNEEVIH